VSKVSDGTANAARVPRAPVDSDVDAGSAVVAAVPPTRHSAVEVYPALQAGSAVGSVVQFASVS
jgi:fructose-1-phosphate kinase PfkB-like protein